MKPPSPVALCAILLALGAPARAQEEGPLAPDGRRGFGAETSLSDLLRQFRTPDEAEELLQTELRDAARDVAVLVSVTEGFYRERGYFELLDPLEDPTLATLHAEFRRYAVDPTSIASRGDRAAETFARMYLDTRFRVRLDLLDGWEEEVADVRGGLAVLRAAAHGFVNLGEDEAHNVARRIDLAGAVLRSMRNDLASLREPMETAPSTGVGPEEVSEFLGLFDIGDRAERERRIAAAVAHVEENEALMKAVLFTTRLRESAAADFARRIENGARARSLLEQARVAMPGWGGEAPRDVARLSKTKRRRLAREKAVLGLAFDPLDDELAWIAAESSYLVYGELEAVSHFDRFLALHGIVHNDDRTFLSSELTDRERSALSYVQDIARLEAERGQ